jgi:integrase
MRPYDLRHAYVSLMIQAGHTVVEVAKWAGHSPQVCLGTYAHPFDTVAERIDPEQAIRAARYGMRADDGRAAG